MSQKLIFFVAWFVALSLVLIALAVGTRPSGPTPTPASTPTPTPVTAGADMAPAVALPPLPELNPADIAIGQQLYAQHCASCHLPNLAGQPNWKKKLANGKYPAPPHDDTGHTWHHRDEVLVQITLNGGDGTGDMSHGDMPAFKDKLTAQQVLQILAFFKSRWSEEHRLYQWQMTVEGH
jgi:mono/diheme cytochrome c family protein